MGILIYNNSDISTCSPMLAFKEAFVCVYAHVHMPEGECMHVVLIWFLLLCKDHDQKQLGVRKSLFDVYFCHRPSLREVRKDVPPNTSTDSQQLLSQ